MMQNLEVQDFSYGILNILDARITKFQNLITIHTDEVIVLFVSVGLFKLGKILTKLMLRDQVTFNQKIQRIVNSGPTYPVIFIFHADVEAFHIKMSGPTVDLLKDGVAFGSLSELLGFEVSGKYFLYFFEMGDIQRHVFDFFQI